MFGDEGKQDVASSLRMLHRVYGRELCWETLPMIYATALNLPNFTSKI